MSVEELEGMYEQLRCLAAKYSRQNGGNKAPTNAQLQQFFDLALAVFERAPRYDVVGMSALEERLRQDLRAIHARDDELNSINRLSMQTGISRTYLARFRDGDSVSMAVMNRIANALAVRYVIGNYEEP